jgi:serine/threonine protein kinase
MKPTDFPQGYKPRHLLGEGSMGTVWLAYSGQAKGHCAVKVLHLRDDRKGSAERSFNREVRAMARLSHPAVIEILDYGRTPAGSPFVAMEYVPGVSLSQYMLGGWTWPRLYTLHRRPARRPRTRPCARPLIHRDLKPGNVLVIPHQASGGIKLVDFGIALAVNEAQTASRRIEGTPAYIAPEAASGEVAAIGPWTDLYSLGVMLFELVTGELPFHGRHLLAHHQRTPLPPVRRSGRTSSPSPAGLVPVIERPARQAAPQRFRTVAAVREALRGLGARPPSSRWPSATPPEQVDARRGRDAQHDGRCTTSPRPIGPSGPGLFFLREPALAGRDGTSRP